MTDPLLTTQVLKRLRWPLRLTFAGVVVEHVAQAFWPFATALMGLAAVLLSGGLGRWPDGLGLALVAGFGLAALITFALGARRENHEIRTWRRFGVVFWFGFAFGNFHHFDGDDRVGGNAALD